MDNETFDTVFKLLQVLSAFVDMLIAGVALVVAIYCSMKKLSIAASWILFGGWALFVLVDIAFIVNDFILNKTLGYEVTRWTAVILILFNLLAGLIFAFSIAMFRKPAGLQPGKEAAHG